MSSHILGEISRLEAEITRIQRELDALRKQVNAPPSTRRTQSFQQMRIDKDAVTREMPASTPPPQPSVPVQSDVVASTKPGSDRRIQTGPRAALSDLPPAQNKRRSSPAPEAGRYEFVGEGRSKRR
jgi:hypothetical protein